jgi:hypothetical protein
MTESTEKPIRYCDEKCLPDSPHSGHVYSHRLPGEPDLDMGDYVLRARGESVLCD